MGNPRTRRRLRIISLPGARFRRNMFFPDLCRVLEASGADIIDIQSRQAMLFQFDCVLVHFPEHYAAEQGAIPAIFWSTLYLAFFAISFVLNKKIVWFVHDVFSFEARNRWLRNMFMPVFGRLVWGHVFLSRTSEDDFKRHNPFYKRGAGGSAGFPHPPYTIKPVSPEEKRRQTISDWGDADVFVAGFIGGIKPYKNLGVLKTIDLNRGGKIRLKVAGKVEGDGRPQVDAVRRHFAGDGRFVFAGGELDSSTFEFLLQTCDVALLPYTVSYNSGMAMHCLSCSVRILASELPIFRELRDMFGATWVKLISDDINRDLETLMGEPVDDAERDELARKLAAVGIERSADNLVRFLGGAPAA